MSRVSKSFLTKAERNVLLKALRNAGIEPPKSGYEIKAFGGDIINHGTQSAAGSRKLGLDRTGYQVIDIDEGQAQAALRRKYVSESKPRLSPFVRSYLETALWSSTDESDELGGESLDKNYSVSDFSDEAIKQAIKDCESFQEHLADQLSEAGNSEQNGHDFWLTRNRHGAGFWDRGYPDEIGDALTEGAHAYGETNAYVGDDGQIYLS